MDRNDVRMETGLGAPAPSPDVCDTYTLCAWVELTEGGGAQCGVATEARDSRSEQSDPGRV